MEPKYKGYKIMMNIEMPVRKILNKNKYKPVEYKN